MSNRSLYQAIERRRWIDIRPIWSAYIPPLESVGQPPDPTLSDFFALSGLKLETPRHRTVLQGSHEIALTEAIFLFQKSIHVARCVEASAANGMLSWAVFQGYHSGYYAAKAVLSLLGVCFPQPSGRQLLVDLFPIPPRKRVSVVGESREVLIAGCSRLEQRLLWGFFGRILRVTEFAPEFGKHIGFLEGLDHERIPRFRNRFIYHEDHWPYGDLTLLRRIADFAFRDSVGPDLSEIAEDHPSFLAVLGMVVPSFLRLMFDELCRTVPAIRPHITYMDSEDWQAGTRMVRSYF